MRRAETETLDCALGPTNVGVAATDTCGFGTLVSVVTLAVGVGVTRSAGVLEASTSLDPAGVVVTNASVGEQLHIHELGQRRHTSPSDDSTDYTESNTFSVNVGADVVR